MGEGRPIRSTNLSAWILPTRFYRKTICQLARRRYALLWRSVVGVSHVGVGAPSTRRGQPMLKITQYQSWAELAELQELWNPLLRRSSNDTVFLTWQWCEAWWRNYGGQRSPFVLAA